MRSIGSNRRNTLATYAIPIIGDMDVAEIATEDVLRVLEPIWRTKPETATRVRGRIENVLDWCRARKLRDGANPALWRGHLKHLSTGPQEERNGAASPGHALAGGTRVYGSVAHELRDVGPRPRIHHPDCCPHVGGDLATPSEFNLTEGVWHVPATRMKASVDHRVPLSERARTIIAGLPQIEGTAYVFPSARGRGWPLWIWPCLNSCAVYARGSPFTAFAARFGTGPRRKPNFPSEVVEMALAHTIESEVERAYRRGDLFQKRRALMEAWAAYCANSRKTMSGESQNAA